MDNFLYIPESNPVVFFDINEAAVPQYLSKHFEKNPFEQRIYFWQQKEQYKQLWMTTDIINLQFESTFDPIIVKILDEWGQEITPFPALIKMANKFLPGTFAFEVSISLANYPTGCYRIQIIAGSGDNKKTLLSNCQYISAEPLPGTILMQYWNSRYHKDVIYETGIKFQLRVLGAIGFLNKVRDDEQYRDQKSNPSLLSNRGSKQWPIYYGIPADGRLSKHEFIGLPDDMINIIDEAWGCDNVLVDGKPFGIADGQKIDYIEIDGQGLYPKRGMKVTAEAGINRNSRVFAVSTDTTKKLVSAIFVQAKVFGDTSGQGSSDTVPVYNVVQE